MSRRLQRLRAEDKAISKLSDKTAIKVADGVKFQLVDGRGEIFTNLADQTQGVADEVAYNSWFHRSGVIELGWASGRNSKLSVNQEHNIALVYLEEWLHGLQELREHHELIHGNGNISQKGQADASIDAEIDVALFMKEQGIQLTPAFLGRYGRGQAISGTPGVLRVYTISERRRIGYYSPPV